MAKAAENKAGGNAAETAPVKTIDEIMEEYVDIDVPFGANLDAPPIFLAVNGETVRVKRGETVSIKRKFVEVLRNSLAQERAAKLYQRAAQQAAAKAAAEM